MAQAAEHLVDHVTPPFLAALPKLVTPARQVVRRVITRHLLGQAGLQAAEANSCAVPLTQGFGAAANPNVHFRCLVLDGVYRCGADGAPESVEATATTDESLQTVWHEIITRMMKPLMRRGG